MIVKELVRECPPAPYDRNILNQSHPSVELSGPIRSLYPQVGSRLPLGTPITEPGGAHATPILERRHWHIKIARKSVVDITMISKSDVAIMQERLWMESKGEWRSKVPRNQIYTLPLEILALAQGDKLAHRNFAKSQKEWTRRRQIQLLALTGLLQGAAAGGDGGVPGVIPPSLARSLCLWQGGGLG
jgi:hypothetical protein